MPDLPTSGIMCGPCNDEICEWMGCSMPGLCHCEQCDTRGEIESEDDQ